MKFYILVVAILAFSTSVDISEGFTCWDRLATTAADVEGEATKKTCSGSTVKCVSYYNADGKSLGDCADDCTGKAKCKICATENCNVRALARKCYDRVPGAAADSEGTPDTQCTNDPSVPAKCISYYAPNGENYATCKSDGCTGFPGTSCRECTTDNCNVRALLATTAAPTTTAAGGAAPTTTAAGGAAPTTTAAGGAAPTTPRAAATRASVGWQTGIMAASACVLVLMKPF